MAQISPFCLQKAVMQVVGLCVVGKQARKVILGHPVAGFMVPQRIVSIETDGRQCHVPPSLSGQFWREEAYPASARGPLFVSGVSAI
jgi:hypothetical protein